MLGVRISTLLMMVISIFFTIVDDHTQYIWTHIMSSKSSAFTLIKDFVSLIKAQFQTIIKVIRTNNAY